MTAPPFCSSKLYKLAIIPWAVCHHHQRCKNQDVSLVPEGGIRRWFLQSNIIRLFNESLAGVCVENQLALPAFGFHKACLFDLRLVYCTLVTMEMAEGQPHLCEHHHLGDSGGGR